MSDVAWLVVDAPWGPIHVAATAGAVVAVEQLVPTEAFTAGLERRFGRSRTQRGAQAPGPAVRHAEVAADQIGDYLLGRRRSFDVPIELVGRPPWDRAVLDGVGQVPWGAVTSYGRVARRIGRPGAARAVGGAVGRNPIGIIVPCHRIIAGDGSLGGYGGDWWGSREALLDIKRELLRIEGITLPADRLYD
ncbi:MAG TPA: methylated-DNA--[protein]-cysteine S-methyltransferase [Vitreimonas sp.]|nr:methylated-DNA--[protein]-cysteine S-methyltransferase [Vitreimonas sp.]